VSTPASTRHDRRVAERARAHEDTRRRRSQPQRPAWRSPFVLATLGAVAVGVIIIGTLILSNKPAATSAEVHPAAVAPPPAAMVSGRSIGSPDAPVTIELWSDFQCPVCEKFALTIEPGLRGTYLADGRVRMTYHDLAFIGKESIDAAAAARIAEEMGAGFWTYHDLLYANQAAENSGAFSRDRLADIAVAAGLDRAAFLVKLADPQYTAAVTAETSVGTAAGVVSTPTLIINGKTYAGLPDYTKLSAVLDGLAPASSGAPSP
jgi:protein-disulfide isomerase